MLLIISDPHIEEKNIDELFIVFTEILTYPKDNELIILGDLFHKKRPTIIEWKFAHQWIKAFKLHYKKVTIIRGNHDNTGNDSNIDVFSYWGINIVDDYKYKSGDYKAYFGHFFVDESLDIEVEKVSLKKLKGYNHILLGHYHMYKVLKGTQKAPTALHIGSVIWTKFDEDPQKTKMIAHIDDKGRLILVPLKTPIPIISTSKVEDLKNIDKRTKVRLVLKSFDYYKEHIEEIQKYKNGYFVEFKEHFEYKKNLQINKPKEIDVNDGIVNIFTKWLGKREDIDVKELLDNVFKICKTI